MTGKSKELQEPPKSMSESTGNAKADGENGKDTTYGLGLNGLMKAFIGIDKFSGTYDEDLNVLLIVSETLSRIL